MTEARELPKGKLVLALAALFLSSMCTLGDLVVNPIVANLYEVFADSPEWLINLGITGPALVGLPFGFLAGVLCDRMDKKWVMVAGFAIFVVSACCGAMITDIYYFVTMRLFATGVGWGVTNTAALAILADLFTDEDEHGRRRWHACSEWYVAERVPDVSDFDSGPRHAHHLPALLQA